MAEVVEVEEPVPSILLPCATCNRTFRPEALVKHAKVCEKSLMKKRKKFDSAQQRIQGTELAQFVPIPGQSSKKKEQSPIKKESKWKEKHIELVESIRAARSPNHHPRSSSKPPGHEQCPHCDRFFGPKAFDRHAEWCKEQQTRVRAKSQACLQAKERLQARTKYRAPLNKTQRAVTKEKYSPVRPQRDPSPLVVQPSNTLTKTSSSLSGSMNISRSTSQRSGLQHNNQISSNTQQRVPLRNESPRRQQPEKNNKKKPEERDTSRIRSMSTQPKMPSKPVLERKRKPPETKLPTAQRSWNPSSRMSKCCPKFKKASVKVVNELDGLKVESCVLHDSLQTHPCLGLEVSGRNVQDLCRSGGESTNEEFLQIPVRGKTPEQTPAPPEIKMTTPEPQDESEESLEAEHVPIILKGSWRDRVLDSIIEDGEFRSKFTSLKITPRSQSERGNEIEDLTSNSSDQIVDKVEDIVETTEAHDVGDLPTSANISLIGDIDSKSFDSDNSLHNHNKNHLQFEVFNQETQTPNAFEEPRIVKEEPEVSDKIFEGEEELSERSSTSSNDFSTDSLETDIGIIEPEQYPHSERFVNLLPSDETKRCTHSNRDLCKDESFEGSHVKQSAIEDSSPKNEITLQLQHPSKNVYDVDEQRGSHRCKNGNSQNQEIKTRNLLPSPTSSSKQMDVINKDKDTESEKESPKYCPNEFFPIKEQKLEDPLVTVSDANGGEVNFPKLLGEMAQLPGDLEQQGTIEQPEQNPNTYTKNRSSGCSTAESEHSSSSAEKSESDENYPKNIQNKMRSRSCSEPSLHVANESAVESGTDEVDNHSVTISSEGSPDEAKEIFQKEDFWVTPDMTGVQSQPCNEKVCRGTPFRPLQREKIDSKKDWSSDGGDTSDTSSDDDWGIRQMKVTKEWNKHGKCAFHVEKLEYLKGSQTCVITSMKSLGESKGGRRKKHCGLPSVPGVQHSARPCRDQYDSWKRPSLSACLSDPILPPPVVRNPKTMRLPPLLIESSPLESPWRSFPHLVRHVIAVLPKRLSIEDLEKYDPYASAELQMMELFSGDNNEGESKDKPLTVESHPATPEEEEVERPSPEGSVATECLAEDNANNNAETRRNLSLSSLSLCSVVSLDSVDCNRNPGLGRRSTSAQARPPPRLVDMHQMLYGSVDPQEADDLEACEAQLLVSMLEFEKMLKRSPTPPDPHPQSSPNLCSSTFGPSDNYRSRIISTPSDTPTNQKPVHQSFDSAYSSLTRKTPTDGLEMNIGDFSQASKFCHECGCKYPLAAAKFCCQCGIRRLAI